MSCLWSSKLVIFLEVSEWYEVLHWISVWFLSGSNLVWLLLVIDRFSKEFMFFKGCFLALVVGLPSYGFTSRFLNGMILLIHSILVGPSLLSGLIRLFLCYIFSSFMFVFAIYYLVVWLRSFLFLEFLFMLSCALFMVFPVEGCLIYCFWIVAFIRDLRLVWFARLFICWVVHCNFLIFWSRADVLFLFF